LTSKEREREEKELDKQKAKSDSGVYAAIWSGGSFMYTLLYCQSDILQKKVSDL
jgi:hypothetical protein